MSTAIPPSASARDQILDEAHEPDGTVRPGYAGLLSFLENADLRMLAQQLREHIDDHDVHFTLDDGTVLPFQLDPVPRLIEAAEWAVLERGLVQRVRTLERFVADVYGPREVVREGVVPARALESCDHLEPLLGDLPDPPVRIAVAGLDVVRDADGRLLVLEDNVRTPSGLCYALAAREALERHLPDGLRDGVLAFDAVELLAGTLAANAPEGVDEPAIAMLSDGPGNSAWWEHARLARLLSIPVVTLAELEVRRGRLYAGAGRSPIDVLYRRTDEDRFTDADGELTTVGAALAEPLRAGTLTCLNGFGSGVADDKLIHAYVDEMVRFYLGEEPLLRSVTTYDLGVDEVRERALERLDELVIKPRVGHGGHGVVVAPHADTADIHRVAAEVRGDPASFIAQEMVMLSRHPTVIEGRLEPRHVDLRPFVFVSPDGVKVAQGGLTRVALGRDALVVNSSQAGGAKDTWVRG